MKYKLTEETIEYNGHILHRIEALKDFGTVRKGDKGGFIESEANLSQHHNCWIGDNAMVYGNSIVLGNAKIYGNAEVFGNAMIYGNTRVNNNAKIYGNALVEENARIIGNAVIHGNAKIFGNANVFDNAEIYSNVEIYGKADIGGDAKIANAHDYIVFKNWWSSGRYITWTRSNNKWKVGCFYGTGEELVAKAYKDSETSGREYKRLVDYVKSILQDTK